MLRSKIAGRVLALVAALLVGLAPATAAAAPVSKPNPAWKVSARPHVSAAAAILMDWQTGQVLYEKNAHARRDPASTTKVLTALIALERAKLTDQIKVSRRAAYTPGSSMYIKPGEVYSLHDLLHGLLLRSGNDAAVAIAEHVAGSVEAFAGLMNAKAKEVGALHSQFANPHGLTDSRHWSTAYDLATITRQALENETFRTIVAQRDKALTFEQLNRDVVLHNTNRLLSSLPGGDGVKTGTTLAAGACLISSATREDHKLVAVVLHAGNRWGDSASLLEWGFANFRLAYLGRSGEVVTEAPVVNGKADQVPLRLVADLPAVMPRQGGETPRLEVQLQDRIVAPIKQGQALGRAAVYDGDRLVAESMLTAARDMPKRNLLDHIYRGLLPLIRWVGELAVLQ